MEGVEEERPNRQSPVASGRETINLALFSVKPDKSVEMKQVQIISRAVTELKVTLPEDWLPAVINWNGLEVVKAEAPGCWLLEEEDELTTEDETTANITDSSACSPAQH